MNPAGFEPAISEDEWPQFEALRLSCHWDWQIINTGGLILGKHAGKFAIAAVNIYTE
jgi:hypothetical protein